MPPDLVLDQEDEDYASSEDSDFAPDAAAAADADGDSTAASDDEAEAQDADTTAADRPAKRKRQQAGAAAVGEEAEDAGFENSGDEAIIGKGKKRLRRAAGHDGEDGEDEGGLIKTRAQRAAERVERKYATATTAAARGPVTIDVDALWREMVEGSSGPGKSAARAGEEDGVDVLLGEKYGAGAGEAVEGEKGGAPAAAAAPGDPDGMIRIKRTYNFAGKVHTEEKLVARDSAEAKLFLASQAGAGARVEDDEADDQPAKRMPRKAFRSVFEPPLPDNVPRRTDLNLGMGVLREAREAATRADAKKLNTVEKSRMDWAGYVDKEGIKDELELAGKSKTSFVGRQDFLARSEARREEEARRARLAGRV